MKYLLLTIMFSMLFNLYANEKSIEYKGKFIIFTNKPSYQQKFVENRNVRECNFEKTDCKEIGKLEQNIYSYEVIKLDDERVFIYGGTKVLGGEFIFPEIYNLKTNISKKVNNPNQGRIHFGSKLVKLSDGNVLIIGGYDASYQLMGSIELFNVKKEAIIELNNLKIPRKDHTVCETSQDLVFIIGGTINNPDFSSGDYYNLVTNSIELFNYKTNRISDIDSMSEARQNSSCIIIKDEFMLISGGTQFARGIGGVPVKLPKNVKNQSEISELQGKAIKTADLFNIRNMKNTKINSMNFSRVGHKYFIQDEGTVLVIGGFENINSSSFITDIEIFNIKNKEFSIFKKLKIGRAFHNISKLQNGNLLIFDGRSSVENTSEIINLR